jgi:glycosyltransferase involved in cell wall biosynthesis
MKLSILIPAYNVEGLLPRCLDSVLKQDVSEVEVVVVDDGSSDRTLEVAEEYAANHKTLRVFSKQNEGVGAARNFLLDQARGEYIWYVDSDDYIFEDSIEKILNVLKVDTSVDMLTILHNDIRKDNLFEGTSEDYIKKRLFNGYLWGKIIRRSVIENHKIRFVPNMYSQEDWLFLMKVYPHLRHIKETGIRAYHYCDDNANSVMRTRTWENIHRNVENSLKTICCFGNFVEEYRGTPIYESYRSWLNYSTSGFLFSLLPLDYSQMELKRMLATLRNQHIYPVGRTDNRRANLFLYFANHESIYIMMARLWRKLKF